MLECAKRLEFEAAARLRDRLAQLKQQLLGVQVAPAPSAAV